MFLIALVGAAMILHYGFAAFGLLPDGSSVTSVTDREFFKVDYTLFLNLAFLALSAVFLWWKGVTAGFGDPVGKGVTEKVLFVLAIIAYLWLAGGLILPPLMGG